MENKVLIKQFKNKAKKPVAGLTPEHAIYDKNGVRLDAKLGNVNLSEFRKAQDDGIKALKEQEKESLEILREYDHETIINNGTINNAADEEDITVRDNVLSFKDRTYTEGINEMGYVILRKNKSFAEQVTKENTIYEIRYEFDLNSENIDIPKSCALLFNGGSINNGSINGNYTEIIDKTLGFLNNVTFKGTWNIKTAYPEWYKYEDDENIQKAIDSFNNVTLIKNTYNIKKSLIIKNNTIINGNGSTLLVTNDLDNVICANTRCYYINISNVIIDCNNKARCGLNLFRS